MKLKKFPRHSIDFTWRDFLTVLWAAAGGCFAQSRRVQDFEKDFAKMVGVPYAIAIPSCRFGIYHYLKFLDPGHGDEVILPAFTFPAVPAAVRASGMVPVFVDSLSGGFNVDVQRLTEEIRPKTRAILVSHLFGTGCDMERVLEAARAGGLKVIEDCAHATGSVFEKRRAGSWGDVGFFSFGIGKNLSTFGGGMMTTACPETYEHFRCLMAALPETGIPTVIKSAVIARIKAALTNQPGFSFITFPIVRLLAFHDVNWLDRAMVEQFPSDLADETVEFLDDIQGARRYSAPQAALGMRKLSVLDHVNESQAAKAEYYDRKLSPALQFRSSAVGRTGEALSYYVLKSRNRNQLRASLLTYGIDTKACDMANCWPECPISQQLESDLFEIPLSRWMTPADLEYVTRSINEAYERALG
ncbi:MAG: hypothetical protein A2X94_07935 [Bdellovibrionales bacterium GWB1_55_8]|nr:MAG: hypothetical protein A2X94_07935 [Bdellovibrionales bacterium GWB1_55_8]